MTNITPETIKTTARKYIGTPFHKQGRIIGVGVDCIGLIICIANDLNISSKTGDLINLYDKYIYNVEKPNGILLISTLNKHLIEKDGEPSDGDIIAFIRKDMHVHVGIVTEKERFIHSCMIRGAVIEEKITNKKYKLWSFNL
jgi:hypothetical protein